MHGIELVQGNRDDGVYGWGIEGVLVEVNGGFRRGGGEDGFGMVCVFILCC